MTILYFIELDSIPIFEQLQLEEALIRISNKNYCLVNKGSSPAIVLGISQNTEEMVHTSKAKELNVPLIRRFSGGGTVVVDEETLFVTYIFNKEVHPFAPFPEPIAKWTESIYQRAFPELPFTLRENDYCLFDRKIGGNAQYLRKDRWLHHTTFLFDYKPHLMQLLQHPKKAPAYRSGRSHLDFITTLKDHIMSKESFVLELEKTLSSLFDLDKIAPPYEFLNMPHRKSTVLLD
jgi:lipoate-protein ligase A